ncbi:MAG: CBS domain-containing protein [Phycisphaerae bacterium]|nr:CBS domain-containing protein [Phycisphaerae bacterium]
MLRQNLVADRVSRIELATPVSVAPTASVREAITRMRAGHCGYVLLCDGHGLKGIFTERDLLIRVLGGKADFGAPIAEVATPDPISIHEDDTVRVVIQRMLAGGYRHLPVVDASGAPVGVVSVRGLIHYLVEHFPGAVYNLPPTPDQAQEDREGA